MALDMMAAMALPSFESMPASAGPHPYCHGDGWVPGSANSDDPLCRDL